MRTSPEPKFLIVCPIIGGVYYWMAPGRGNTANIWEAHKYPESRAREIVEKSKGLKMIPAK